MSIHERFPFSWKMSRVPVPTQRTKEVLGEDITILNLSCRSNNGLKRHAINTIGDVINKYNDLWKVRGIGVTSVNEIKEKLETYLANIQRTDLLKLIPKIEEEAV